MRKWLRVVGQQLVTVVWTLVGKWLRLGGGGGERLTDGELEGVEWRWGVMPIAFDSGLVFVGGWVR